MIHAIPEVQHACVRGTVSDEPAAVQPAREDLVDFGVGPITDLSRPIPLRLTVPIALTEQRKPV